MSECGCDEKKVDVISESDYSEDEEDQKHNLDPALRARYPHLSVAKIAALKGAWLGRSALHKKQRSAVQELATLKAQLATKTKPTIAIAEASSIFDGIF